MIKRKGTREHWNRTKRERNVKINERNTNKKLIE